MMTIPGLRSDDTSEIRFVARLVLILISSSPCTVRTMPTCAHQVPCSPLPNSIACPEQLSAAKASNDSLCPSQIHARVNWLVPRHHVGPILNVMVGVDGSEDRMVHVSVVGASADVEKIKFHRFPIRRGFRDHAWPVSGIAIMHQCEPIII